MAFGLDFRRGAWGSGPLLPPGAGRDLAVSFVIAVLCFLAAASAIGALAANRAAAGWRAEVTGSASVLVRPTAGESLDAAAARAAEALSGAPGVDEAAVLRREEAEALLRPWLGSEVLADLPIPRLVAVELDRRSPASLETLKTALREAGVDGQVDDHSLWIGDIVRASRAIRIAAAGVALLLALAAAAVIALATRAALERWHTAVEVLHFAGAEDRFIAGLVMRRFAWQALQAGALGGLLAAGLGAGLRLGGEGAPLIPVLPVIWSDLYAALAAPLAAFVVGAISARRSAFRLLGRYP